MSCLVSSARGGSRSPSPVGEARRLAEGGAGGGPVWSGRRKRSMSCLVSSARGGSRSPSSVGEARRLAEVGVVGQLVEHEPGDVGARDLELQPLLGGREAVPVLARASAVGEGRRTDYRPIQCAVLDVLLPLLVGSGRAPPPDS